MKTIQDYLNNLDKTDKGKFGNEYPLLETLAREFNIQFYDYLEVEEIKTYWGPNWICTDTKVGVRFYFLNEEFVCTSFQGARKSDEQFFWASKETFNKVRNLVINKIVIQWKEQEVGCDFVDWSEDLGEIEEYANKQK